MHQDGLCFVEGQPSEFNMFLGQQNLVIADVHTEGKFSHDIDIRPPTGVFEH